MGWKYAGQLSRPLYLSPPLIRLSSASIARLPLARCIFRPSNRQFHFRFDSIRTLTAPTPMLQHLLCLAHATCLPCACRPPGILFATPNIHTSCHDIPIPPIAQIPPLNTVQL